MKSPVPVALLLLALGGALGAQQAQSSEVFAPFVSRLKAVADESGVVLTWRKSSDIDGAYLIYRSKKEITDQTFPQAEFILRVAAGTESYTDYPPFGLDVYYAVLIEGADGKLYSIFIPFRNKTTTAVSVRPPPPEQEIAAEVTRLKASIQGEAIVLTFSASSADRPLILFRSTRQIRRVEDIVATSSVVPLSAGSTMYEDRPIPGVEYYYAVVDAKLLQAGKAAIVPGQNSLSQSSQVPLSAAQAPSRARSRPLPRLMIPAGVEFGDELIPSAPFLLPRQQELGPAAAKAVARLRASIRPAPRQPPVPVILEEDRAAGARGEDSLVADIVQGPFAAKSYTDAEDRLQRFLRIERGPKAEARAHYYIGQIQYLRGDFQDAFLTFLLANELYYAETQPWIDACFVELE
jgi:hypothetical protein